MTTFPDELTGDLGTARRVPDGAFADRPAALTLWIITAPAWHPLWSQYSLSVVSLADIPGTPPAIKKFPGATHELLVMALNPDHGPYDAHTVRSDTLHHLTPINIAEQFTTTDTQAQQLATLCVRAVVDGRLNPETADAPERIRASWSQAIEETLDHASHDRPGSDAPTAPAPAPGEPPC